jgi:hypothetical protein
VGEGGARGGGRAGVSRGGNIYSDYSIYSGSRPDAGGGGGGGARERGGGLGLGGSGRQGWGGAGMGEGGGGERERAWKVTVMRHAEKLDDVDPHWSACAERPYDAPITDAGCAHAKEVGVQVGKAGADIDVVVCSPFLRCLQTTQHFLEGYEAARACSTLPVAIDPGL